MWINERIYRKYAFLQPPASFDLTNTLFFLHFPKQIHSPRKACRQCLQWNWYRLHECRTSPCSNLQFSSLLPWVGCHDACATARLLLITRLNASFLVHTSHRMKLESNGLEFHWNMNIIACTVDAYKYANLMHTNQLISLMGWWYSVWWKSKITIFSLSSLFSSFFSCVRVCSRFNMTVVDSAGGKFLHIHHLVEFN